MEDSGNRREFTTGAVRDRAEDKPRPALISPFASERLGVWLAKGARKYSSRNWEKGMPISECIESLERHIMRYKQGLADEDHMAAVMCNAMFILHYEEGIRRGFLPRDLDDMPRYLIGCTESPTPACATEALNNDIPHLPNVRPRLELEAVLRKGVRGAIVRGLVAIERGLL